MMRVGIMQPYFFPYIGYFQLIHAVDIYVNLDHVSFMKRSYMVRNEVKNDTKIGFNVYDGSQNKNCREVLVNFENNYISKFLKTIQHLYSKSPYYTDVVEEIIIPSFRERTTNVSDFNLTIIRHVCHYLNIETKIIDSSAGITNAKKAEGIQEIVHKFSGTVYINAIGGRDLYDKAHFKDNGIDLFFLKMNEDIDLDNPFSSILDVLFNYPRGHIQGQLPKYKLV